MAYKILLESDSLVLFNTVLGRCERAWPVIGFLRQIRSILRFAEFELTHDYKEANMIADKLANQGVQDRVSTDFSVALVLPVT